MHVNKCNNAYEREDVALLNEYRDLRMSSKLLTFCVKNFTKMLFFPFPPPFFTTDKNPESIVKFTIAVNPFFLKRSKVS